MDLTVTPYSDKSFKVSGAATRTYSNQLKDLGGRYNSNLKDGPGWIFSNTKYDVVNEFVQQVQGSECPLPPPVQRRQYLPKPSAQQDIPIPRKPLPQPPQRSNYQTVTYTVPRPQHGMRVLISFDGNQNEYQVVGIEQTDNVTDTVMIQGLEPNELLTLVITNGKWQVLGIADTHSITFEGIDM